MRHSTAFFYSLTIEAILLGLLFWHASFREGMQQGSLREKIEMVKTLKLTDLCLFTEARYTRHLSQADLSTPFQDYPLSLEHFPSGAFTQPPTERRTSP